MRRLVLLLVILLVVPFVYAQACGDGTLNYGEECDLPGQDAACPGYCQIPDCVCTKEVQEVLYDLYSGHNLLLSKSQDLAHISKDQAYQDELKVIQYGLRQAFLNPPNGSCQNPPVMFMLTAEYSPYGKENEIDAFNNYLLSLLSDATLRQQLDVSNAQYDNASTLQSLAETYLASGNYLRSAQAKCCAYNQLIENETLYLADNGSCEVLEFCGDGEIKPSEECGEPDLECPAGETCINCHCYPPTTSTGGGGSNKQLQYAVGCCKAFDYLAGSLAAEYYCCGGQDMTGPTGSHIDCCAQPELPQCRPYCTLTSCSPPYALDIVTQKCVMTEPTRTVQAGADLQRPAEQTACTPGYVMENNRCVQKQEVVETPVKPVEIIKALEKSSVVNIMTGILILIAIALVVYLIMTRKRSPKITLPKFTPIKSAENLDAMKSQLDDLNDSYDKLEKMIKSMKGGKV